MEILPGVETALAQEALIPGLREQLAGLTAEIGPLRTEVEGFKALHLRQTARIERTLAEVDQVDAGASQ